MPPIDFIRAERGSSIQSLVYETVSFSGRDRGGLSPRILRRPASFTQHQYEHQRQQIGRRPGKRAILPAAARSAGSGNEMGRDPDFAGGIRGIRAGKRPATRRRRY